MTNEGFDENNIPPVEKESNVENTSTESVEQPALLREHIVLLVKKEGTLNKEALDLLDLYENQKYEELVRQGERFPRTIALFEKAYVLRLAGHFEDAILVMENILEIATNENDDESVVEANRALSKLKFYVKGVEDEEKRKQEKLEEVKFRLEAISGPKIPREEVLESYKHLSQKVGSPDDLDSDEPQVKLADTKYKIWMKQKEVEGEANEDTRLRNNFEQTMLFVDAGFIGKDYLEEVLSLLYQDSADVEKDLNSPAKVELRKDMAKAMLRIRALLKM